MASRLVPLSIFRAHWRSLSDYSEDEPRPDWTTRVLLLALPGVVATCILLFGGKISSPASILAGITLLATGALAVYGQIAQHRSIYTDRMEEHPRTERKERDSLDETASHLLMVAYLSGLDAILLLVAMNFGSGDNEAIVGIWAALVAFVTVYIFLTFLILVPRIYSAYVQANKVRKELNGHFTNK